MLVHDLWIMFIKAGRWECCMLDWMASVQAIEFIMIRMAPVVVVVQVVIWSL